MQNHTQKKNHLKNLFKHKEIKNFSQRTFFSNIDNLETKIGHE